MYVYIYIYIYNGLILHHPLLPLLFVVQKSGSYQVVKKHKHIVRIYKYLLTYLLTPWCRILLEKLTGLQLVKKFPSFHGTRRFITALTSVRHLSLSWACPIQSIYPHPTSWRSIVILSTHLRLGLPQLINKQSAYLEFVNF